MKKLNIALLALSVVAFGSQAAGPDMSGVTGSVDVSTIVAAIAAIAALKILPGVARWGFNQVQKLFG